jgi:dipeptidyl aminopeptidase
MRLNPPKQWRWSSHANYFVHKLSINYTRAVSPTHEPPVISTAIMSPASPPTVLFVERNDLYMLKLPALRDPPIRITHDGSNTVFNGAPDWVYEEEVFGGDKASWWCPDGQKIAFLRFDETNVNEYKFPVYNEGYLANTYEAYTPFVSLLRFTLKVLGHMLNTPLVRRR